MTVTPQKKKLVSRCSQRSRNSPRTSFLACSPLTSSMEPGVQTAVPVAQAYHVTQGGPPQPGYGGPQHQPGRYGPYGPQQPMMQPMAGIGGQVPPPGCPPGGQYGQQQYIGIISIFAILLLLFFFWPLCFIPLCAPCDSRQVYRAPNGVTYNRLGYPIPAGGCCGNPCG